MSKSHDTPHQGAQQTLIRNNALLLSELPSGEFVTAKHAPETYPYAELPSSERAQLSHAGIIKRVRRENVSSNKRSIQGAWTFVVWRVPVEVRELAQEIVDERVTMVPGCKHTGVRKLDDDCYTCCDASCENTVSEYEVRL